MRMSSWLQSLSLSLKRAGARRPQRVLVQLERLEDRTVPVCINFDAGTGALIVALDPPDMDVSIHAQAGPNGSTVVVTVDGVDFRGDGNPPADDNGNTFTANAEDVKSILVWAKTDLEPNTNCGGNTNDNLID